MNEAQLTEIANLVSKRFFQTALSLVVGDTRG
jgi:hypothetical protein